jgi:hypothetical protein
MSSDDPFWGYANAWKRSHFARRADGAGQRGLRRSASVVGGHFRGQSQATIDREVIRAMCEGVLGGIPEPGAASGSWSEVVPARWVVQAQRLRARGSRGLCGSARLAELYQLSLLLKAIGSAGGSAPEPGRITHPARVTGSVATAAGVGA